MQIKQVSTFEDETTEEDSFDLHPENEIKERGKDKQEEPKWITDSTFKIAEKGIETMLA